MEVVDTRRKSTFEMVKSNAIVKKILAIKNIRLIVVAIIIATALIIYSSVDGIKNKDANTSQMVMDEEETRLASILSGIEGVGQVQTMITREDGTITGVLVIAEGAEDISVMLKLLSATSTVMGVDKKVVEVYQME